MAYYKYSNYIAQNEDKAFDDKHKPGDTTPYSGIYRCMGCSKEIVSEEGKPFPPQNQHQHSVAQGDISWRMIAYAVHNPK